MLDILVLVIGFAASVVTTLVVIPWLIPKLIDRGIVGRDLNKPSQPSIAEMGGVAVVIGYFTGISVTMALDGIEDAELLYISLSAVLGAAFVGILDDLFELRQRQKAFLPFLLALPFGVAIDSQIYIPFIGEIELGLLMIFTAPFAITCAANAGNMLEGFNGLGAGLGITMSATLVVLAFHHDRLDGAYILVPLSGGLVSFLWFNRYPARIFPGDTLMLFMGAVIAVGGMLSNLYIQTTVIFIPMIIEFFLKLRGRFKAENYSSLLSNGRLQYVGRIESLTHLLMRRAKLTERSIVVAIWGIEAVICATVILVDLAI